MLRARLPVAADRFVLRLEAVSGRPRKFVDLGPGTSDAEPVFRARVRPPTVLKFMDPGEPQSDFLGHELLISVERHTGGRRNSVAV